MQNPAVYAFTVSHRDTRDRLILRVVAHFEFSLDGRKLAEKAMSAIENAGFEGPVGRDAYPIGHSYIGEV